MSPRARKLYAGARLRDLRQRDGHSQREMAARLRISASYLNQIENDLRPLPPALMLRICENFGVEAGYFDDSHEMRRLQLLREILSDPVFKMPLRPQDIDTALRAAPALTDHFIALYRAFRTLRGERALAPATPAPASPAPASPTPAPPDSEPVARAPYEAVGDWVQQQRNYFDEIDRAAERLYEEADLGSQSRGAGLERHLLDRHGVRVATEGDLAAQGLVWRFDRRGKRLILADGLPGESRNFSLAQIVGRLDCARLLDRCVRRSGLSGEDARALARVSMSNYFAGALLLPYERFRHAARETKHDIDVLQRQFEVSFEQVCHRLSTLQRPGAEGIPFYFIKVDVAGNILKSFSATRFSEARFGGLCSLWNAFQCFATPGKLLVQLSQNTDDAVFLAVARTVGQPPTSYFERGRHVAVVLGCSVAHAEDIIYSAGLNLADRRLYVPIGPGCRACTRTSCRHRALPGSGFAIAVGNDERGVVPYRMGGGTGHARAFSGD
ncbi:helix-turn-helix domain-containing protein [Acidomonas methanolica]|uniref:helix-turn-helix domain-containing protein n=1 Tax=Acidomonas methanolica TaxID=437 RepID=UPI00211AA395|nr:helix-turn-helix transcriptional regulator [Acidomonas methanolica]MCQ9155702.1 DUF2083 domain-containing protein [Acidomonas methanolica]